MLQQRFHDKSGLREWPNAAFPCSRLHAWMPDESRLCWVTTPGAKGYLRGKHPWKLILMKVHFDIVRQGDFWRFNKNSPRTRHMVNEPEAWPVTCKAIDHTHWPVSKASQRSTALLWSSFITKTDHKNDSTTHWQWFHLQSMSHLSCVCQYWNWG